MRLDGRIALATAMGMSEALSSRPARLRALVAPAGVEGSIVFSAFNVSRPLRDGELVVNGGRLIR